MHETWLEEMRQRDRHLRGELEAAARQIRQLAEERDAARGALRHALRVGRQLADSCHRLTEGLEVTQAAALECLCREWDAVGDAARRVLP